MLQRWFLEHPRSVGETYFEHHRTALSFSASLLSAGAKCFIHAFIPCLFQQSASRSIAVLHDRMNKRTPPESRAALSDKVGAVRKLLE